MNAEFIVSLLGSDRLGLVKSLLQGSLELEGQWLTSKFTNLDGQFSALIRVSVPQHNEQRLKQFFAAQDNITALFNPVGSIDTSDTTTLKLNVEARDQFGLINEISHRLATLSVSITHMECHRISIIELGSTLLSVDLTLSLPADIARQEVMDTIDAIDTHVVVTAP